MKKKFWILSLFITALCVNGATYYVDKGNATSSDSNAGSMEKPLKTIRAAAKKVQAGDTVIVRPGIYRESVLLTRSGKPGSPIIFKSDPEHKAIISGADPLTGWKLHSSGIWMVNFDKISDAVNPKIKMYRFDQPIMGQWLYHNGYPMLRKKSVDELLPGMFYLDPIQKRVYLAADSNFNPNNEKLEFAWRRGLFICRAVKPNPYISDIQINGFTFIHDASWAYGRAVNYNGIRGLIENNRVFWGSARALTVNNGKDCVIRNNVFDWMGCLCWGAICATKFTFENNRVFHGNWRMLNPSHEGGGSKAIHTLDSIVRNNEYAWHYEFGLWYDGYDTGNIFEGNVCHDILRAGIFSEIDYNNTIRNNVCYNNGVGIQIGESRNELVERNILVNNGIGIKMRWFFRPNRGRENMNAEAKYWSKDAVKKAVSEKRFIHWLKEYDRQIRPWDSWTNKLNHLNENFFFNNDLAIWEFINYSNPADEKYFKYVGNFSDRNIFVNERRKDIFGHRNGRYDDLATWRRASGRDIDSQFHDKLDLAKLPKWVNAKHEILTQRFNPYDSIVKMNLQVTRSPMKAQLFGRLLRAEKIKPFKIANPNVKAVEFTLNKERIIALWSTQAKGEYFLRLKIPENSIEVESGYLERKKLELKNGMLTLLATFNPVYLRNLNCEIRELPDLLSFECESFHPANKEIQVTLVVENQSDNELLFEAELFCGQAYSPNQKTVSKKIPAKKTERISVKLTSDGTLKRGRLVLRAVGTLGDESIFRNITFLIGEGQAKLSRRNGGFKKLSDDEIKKLQPFAAINSREQVARPDPSKWTGEKDLSAAAYAFWDKKNLYVLMDVKDDVVVNAPEDCKTPWDYDSVELFIDGRGPAMQWDANPGPGCSQIGVSPGFEKYSDTVARRMNENLKGIVTSSSKTPEGYRVKITVPFSKENFPAGKWWPGRAIKLSFLINDKDNPESTTRKCVLGWSFSEKGLNFMDTSGWKTVKLVR